MAMSGVGLCEGTFIGIGSNVGDSVQNCTESIGRIASHPLTRLLGASSLYATSPVSDVAQEQFVNCVIAIVWKDSPITLLRFLNGIEHAMGRIRTVPSGPRIIDLDILLFGDIVLESPLLTIPHPRLHLRKFALVPCLELNPLLVHPLYNKYLSYFLEGLGSDQKISVLTNQVTL
jgi:2-amino-4-hydroxy-6-hydroxymethyldihydropteridine diphosphokinase